MRRGFGLSAYRIRCESMFIFDADAHLSLTEEPALTAEELIASMDRAGIDKSVVWLQPPYMRTLDAANRYVYESARRYSDRFVPIGWADPHFGVDKALDMVKRCDEEYGMLGVKLNGAQNTFYIDDLDTVEPIIAEIEKRGLVLALHIGADFYDFTHPYRAAKIAKRHPGLRMLLAHMGGAGMPNLGNACIEAAQECPHMLLIGSAISYKMVRKGIETLGAKRICFGSDAPFAYQDVEVAAYRQLLRDLPEAEQCSIMGGNIQAFLKKD